MLAIVYWAAGMVVILYTVAIRESLYENDD
jgi:hypothetical protein